PAHRALSVAIAIACLAAVYLAVRAYRRLLGWGQAGRRGASTALLGAALGAHLCNRFVLPRLYGWFHLTLSLITLVLAVAAARLLPDVGRRLRLPVLAAVAALACGWSFFQLSRSQVLRFAAYERTVVAATALRVVPQALRYRTLAGAER